MDTGVVDELNPVQAIQAVLERLRSRLQVATDSPELRLVLADIAELTERSARLASQESDQAVAFDALCRLDGAFREAQRRWSLTLAGAGRRAADGLLGSVDVYAGWRGRWVDLVEMAWRLRGEQRGQAFGLTDGTSLFTAIGPKHALVLDLRYGANAGLADIARYVGRSVASVQTDIASFEQIVLFTAAFVAAERQVPTGWDLRKVVRGREEVAVLRPHERDTRLRDIEIPVLADWGRENAVGRPRLTPPLALSTERIWAIVVPAGQRVRFIPERKVEVETRSRRPGEGEILFAARYDADDVLQDSVAWILDRRRPVGGEVQRA